MLSFSELLRTARRVGRHRGVRGLLLAATLAMLAPAQALAGAALVIDANTGDELHARGADTPHYPASLTKMMTLYLVFERIEQRKLSFDGKIVMSERAVAQPPSSLDLAAGATLTVRDAVLALVVKSANDVAYAVAEHLGGSEARFAQMMTAKARQLGMNATTFRNASGLPDSGQVTTARDMITLGMRLAHDFPQHYRLFATRQFSFAGHTYRNHNTLLFHVDGIDGIKTGYTRSSGFNLVSSLRRNNRHVMGVVMGSATAAHRNAQMRSLLLAALSRAKPMDKPMLRQRPQLVAAPAKPPVPRKVPATVTVAEAPAAAQIASAPPPLPAAAAFSAAAPARARAPAAPSSPPSASQQAAAPIPSAPASIATPPVRASADGLLVRRVETTRIAVAPLATPAQSAPPETTRAAPAAQAAEQRTSPSADVRPAEGPRAPGRPPSTLAEQAAGAPLARTSGLIPTPTTLAQRPASSSRDPAPPHGLGAKPSTSGAAIGTSGGYHVQIGAYATAAEAGKRLAEVAGRTPSLLAGRSPLTLPFNKASTTVYRARFASFDEAGAQATCARLKQQQIDCIVMRGE